MGLDGFPINQKCLFDVRKEGIAGLRSSLKKHRYAMVDGETMEAWLNADYLHGGSSVEEAWGTFRQLWDAAPAQLSLDCETIYEHKKVFHSSYDFAAGLREDGQGFVRNTAGIVTDEDGTRRQRYLAHDTTSTKGHATPHFARFYPALPDTWDKDPLVKALHRLFSDVTAEPHQRRMGIQQPFASNMFQFCYRTEMSGNHAMRKGDPGPEGVHVDGGTAAMILVVRRDNIKPKTGGTRIWSMEQGTGKPTAADVESEKLLDTWTPSLRLDALFFLDESVLHEALRGELIDPDAPALRDMFILDVRRSDLSWFGDLPAE